MAHYASAPPVHTDELLRIRERMVCRGPDGGGLWISPDRCVGLAHRRLAILDLNEAGAQPMATPDDRLHIVFNGVIYNLGFDEYRGSPDDEAPVTERAAERLGARHTTRRMLEAMDQPSIDGVNAYFVSKAAAEDRAVPGFALGSRQARFGCGAGSAFATRDRVFYRQFTENR